MFKPASGGAVQGRSHIAPRGGRECRPNSSLIRRPIKGVGRGAHHRHKRREGRRRRGATDARGRRQPRGLRERRAQPGILAVDVMNAPPTPSKRTLKASEVRSAGTAERTTDPLGTHPQASQVRSAGTSIRRPWRGAFTGAPSAIWAPGRECRSTKHRQFRA